MATALVPLANGFEEVEAVTIIDVLRRGDVEVVLASVQDDLEVTGAHGLLMKAETRLADVAEVDFDAVVLPGGGEGTANLKKSEVLAQVLRRQQEADRLLCAICAAPTVLTNAGVVPEGVVVTCYPTCQLDLDRSWNPSPVVADRNFITGQAPGSAMLFALVVLQELMGETLARNVARGLVFDGLDA